eukprot:gene625-3204_t
MHANSAVSRSKRGAHWRSPPREFDDTLGYPGEGHTFKCKVYVQTAGQPGATKVHTTTLSAKPEWTGSQCKAEMCKLVKKIPHLREKGLKVSYICKEIRVGKKRRTLQTNETLKQFAASPAKTPVLELYFGHPDWTPPAHKHDATDTDDDDEGDDDVLPPVPPAGAATDAAAAAAPSATAATAPAGRGRGHAVPPQPTAEPAAAYHQCNADFLQAVTQRYGHLRLPSELQVQDAMRENAAIQCPGDIPHSLHVHTEDGTVNAGIALVQQLRAQQHVMPALSWLPRILDNKAYHICAIRSGDMQHEQHLATLTQIPFAQRTGREATSAHVRPIQSSRYRKLETCTGPVAKLLQQCEGGRV